jgi:hypothetical protein
MRRGSGMHPARARKNRRNFLICGWTIFSWNESQDHVMKQFFFNSAGYQKPVDDCKREPQKLANKAKIQSFGSCGG